MTLKVYFNRFFWSCLALAMLFFQWPSLAQVYPDHPITLVIPYPPGSSTNDILGRLLAKKLSEKLGQQVVPENRPGASGNLGSMLVAKSQANGYILLVGVAAPLSVGPNINKNLGYDPIKDLAPVAMFANTPYVMVVNSSVPASNSKELLALARSKPGTLNFASSGVGGTPHLCGELFNSMGGVQITHIPYKGAADAMTDLLSGRVDMLCTGFTALEEHIKSGRLKPIGIATNKRSDLLPNLMTFEEQGLTGFLVNSWTGLFAPAKTPEWMIKKLSLEVQKITNDPQTQAALLKQGSEPMYMAPDQLGLFLKSDTAKWGAVIKSAAITAE
jgi:tripartite-type tricarboxylate transporter receptor subunit TctC